MLSDKPLHVRKKIALLATGIVAIILLALLVVLYSAKDHTGGPKDKEGTSFRDFYKTISKTTQSFFGGE